MLNMGRNTNIQYYHKIVVLGLTFNFTTRNPFWGTVIPLPLLGKSR